MSCADLQKLLRDFGSCVETQDGCRISTHCLYPSFEPVTVFVAGFGDGYRVHDGGGAMRIAWVHGRDQRIGTKMLERYAARYHLQVADDSLVCVVSDKGWLLSAILAVANASAAAANEAMARVSAATESDLKDRIYDVVSRSTPPQNLAREYAVIGSSGKTHYFDFFVRASSAQSALIDAVAPHPISISSKYVAFADTSASPDLLKYAVHDRPLESGDSALLLQVSYLVPFSTLPPLLQKIGYDAQHTIPITSQH